MLQNLREIMLLAVEKLREKIVKRNKSRFDAWAQNTQTTSTNRWAIVDTTSVGNLEIIKDLKEFFEPKDISGKINIFTTVGLTISIVGIILINVLTTSGYSVLVNNKEIASVEKKETAYQALKEFISDKEKKYHYNIKTIEKVEIKEGEVKEINIASLDQIKEKLDQSVHIVTQATGIKVNGKMELVVSSLKDGEAVLKNLSQPAGIKIVNASAPTVRLKEKVELVSLQVNPGEIKSIDQALKIILTGKEKLVTYKVSKGDTLWTIARANDMHISDLRIANPILKGENLKIGQVINLNKIEPIINVESTLTATVTETLAYQTKINRVNSLIRGKRKVIQEGTNGTRKVTYSLVLLNGQTINKKEINAVVLKPAKAKVINVGTKFMLASRGGGSLAWPKRGPITSGFGSRWGRMHTGLDIDGVVGDSVGAAEGGRVITAGWYYEYGQAIIIDHGNGICTLYGHLSSINVRVGENVSRGQFIGRLGNTGRSTGSHLHFEVRINGNPVNPLRYL